MTRSRVPIAIAVVVAFFGNAALICAGADTTCAARGGTMVRWTSAAPVNEHAALDRWCAGVGAPARITGLRGPEVFTGRFAIVTWNTHVGAGNLDELVADLRSGRLTGGAPVTEFVLLLQEVYRTGTDVPGRMPGHLLWASAQQPPRLAGTREDILSLARRLGLHGIYVPSMRNGAPLATDEDRGNAMLATVPLSELTAIELPLERQRRVAIQAVVRVRTTAGADVPVTLVDTHFTNMVLHHLWLFSEAGRTRQAVALSRVLPAAGPLIIGGDFNAWFGFRDAAYRELARHARPAPDQDGRASFGPLRLDHVLFRLPEGWKAVLQRADHRYGSDHYPLVAMVTP